MIIHFDAVRGASQWEKDVYRECLNYLLASFVKLLNQLDGDETFYYTFSTRKNAINQPEKIVSALPMGMYERSRNFLVVALINLAALTVPLEGSPTLVKKIQDVSFTTVSPIRFFRNSPAPTQLLARPSLRAGDFRINIPSTLPSSLARSFAKYLGKDQLIIVTSCGLPVRLPTDNILNNFNTTVPTVSLESLITSALAPALPSEDTDTDAAEVAAAVTKLQRIWRRSQKYRASRQAALLTREGRATAFVLETLVAPDRQGPTKTHVLTTVGVELYVEVQLLREEVAGARALEEKVLANKNMSPGEIEELVSGEHLRELEEVAKKAQSKRVTRVQLAYASQRIGWMELESGVKGKTKKVRGLRKRLGKVVNRLEMMLR